jgi:hypothetical protein
LDRQAIFGGAVLKQDLINRARRMTFALFAISLNRQEYRLILSLFSSSLDFWNNAQVKA